MPTTATSPQARHVLPSFVERTSYGTQESDFLGTPVDGACANHIMAQLICLESTEPDRPISLSINSPGGSLAAMAAVHDTMQYVRPPVHTYCLGQAASAAAVLLAAGAPGHRSVVPSARVLLHQPSLDGYQGQVSDLEIQAAEVSRLRRFVESALAAHTGRGAETVRADLERDLFLTAQQAVGYGIADQIVPTRKAGTP